MQTFTATTLTNVRALLDSMQSPTFIDDHPESVEPVAECLAAIFERASITLRMMLQTPQTTLAVDEKEFRKP